MIGLGVANIGASLTGGFPVTGGFSRSVVNFDAGAATPAAGAFTAVGLAIAAVALTPLIYFLPTATLAATIIVAVLSLVDFSILKRSWAYNRGDFAAVATTILLTLALGVEAGISAGVLLSVLLHLWLSQLTTRQLFFMRHQMGAYTTTILDLLQEVGLGIVSLPLTVALPIKLEEVLILTC